MLRLVLAAVICPIVFAATTAQCKKMLDKALADGNPDTRKQAVAALSLAGNQLEYLTMLEHALSDKDVQVRMTAVASLADSPDRRATNALTTALHDSVPEVSFAAAKALLTRGSREGKEAMLSVLEGETKTSSNFLSKQMRETLRLMHTPKGMFLFALRQGAGFAPVPGLMEGISSLQNLLEDPGVSGRATAALLLERERDARTLVALKDALNDRDWSVRAAAVHSLAVRNDPSLRDSIAELLSDKKEGVRLRAAAGWLRLSGLRKPRASRSEKSKH